MQGQGFESIAIMLLYLAVLFGAMYLFVIRPQKKKQKAEEKMRNELQIGDEIITVGGVYGRIVSIKEDSLVIESPIDHSKTRIAKWAVQANLTIHDDK
ncbi:MAG TPA: preprotein translocase subunit YajC [Clostridiales bacterium]|nr:preprotein translocase subunit YajC [Clostridiales bacterium]